MSAQLSLPMPYPPGHCERIKWQPGQWPTHIKDARGTAWSVLHIGGVPTASSPAVFCCFKPNTVGYHTIKDTEAFHA